MSTKKPLPLPRIRGPKLEPFRGTASADIEFIEFIGSEEDMDSKVWKVRIDNTVYALKIFRFQNWKALRELDGGMILPPDMDPLHRPELTPEEYTDYLDPFNCECRVYGRLKQEQREDLAIRAHGYVLLTKDQEQRVTEGLNQDYTDWENHPEPLSCDGVFWRWEIHRHMLLRAIVKDYVEPTDPWTAVQIPQMYADLEDLHKLGILVRDIHRGNYLKGKLLDFSMAWTMYHPCIARINKAGIKKIRSREPYMFERMVDNWAFYYEEEIEKPEALVNWDAGNNMDDYGFDPRLYDWQKWEDEEDEDEEGDNEEEVGITHS